MKRKILSVIAALSLGLCVVSTQGCYDVEYPGGYGYGYGGGYPAYEYGPVYGWGHPWGYDYGWHHDWDHDDWGQWIGSWRRMGS
jgi:hypothetical protein